MPKMPTPEVSTLSAINSPAIEELPRPYLGMSQLGHPCERYLWYSFRWFYKSSYSRRIDRLFDRGHREEPVVIKELERIGLTVEDSQLEFVEGWGHIKGHCDGVVEGVLEAPKTTHILEIKTASEKKFKEMCKLHLKEANPVYYAQCQLYMHMSKLTRALFVMVNKNDDNWYIERIKYDKNKARELIHKGRRIILAQTPPTRQFPSSYFACRRCDAYQICHKGAEVEEKNCRTCKYSAPLASQGEWSCSFAGVVTITGLEAQKKGCVDHELIEAE